MIKYRELQLIWDPRFHTLHEHDPILFLELSAFWERGEDDVEKCH